jgi:hypothetical protein
MTWGDLEQIVDASDLSLRTHAVLRAYTKHINPPIEARPYPENMIVWPSMEAVVDLSRCSQAMVQRAKHELVTKGILELVGKPGRGRTPRYRVNEQKIQRDEAVLERQQQRRERWGKGSHGPEGGPTKGSQSCEPLPYKGWQRYEPLPHKGSQRCEPFGHKGSQERDPEVIPGSKSSKEPNFFQDAADPEPTPIIPKTQKRTLEHSQTPLHDETAETFTSTALLTEKLKAWAAEWVPGLNLGWQAEKFLASPGAQGKPTAELPAGFRYWLMIAVEIQAKHGTTATPTTRAPTHEVRCSWNGCDTPRCGHGPQACRTHGWGTCDDCLAEAGEAPPDTDLGHAPSRRRAGGPQEDGRALELDPDYARAMAERKALLRAQAVQLGVTAAD